MSRKLIGLGVCPGVAFAPVILIEKEEIAEKKGFTKIAIIAGTGVRGYYKNLGYNLINTYMIKDINNSDYYKY